MWHSFGFSGLAWFTWFSEGVMVDFASVTNGILTRTAGDLERKLIAWVTTGSASVAVISVLGEYGVQTPGWLGGAITLIAGTALGYIVPSKVPAGAVASQEAIQAAVDAAVSVAIRDALAGHVDLSTADKAGEAAVDAAAEVDGNDTVNGGK